MARSNKKGIEYFSHDVDTLQDRKMKLLRALHGMNGYAIYFILLEEIYRDEGYYLKTDEEFNILFCSDNNIELNVYINVLNDCINKELFNKKLYDKYEILTSTRIQSNYISATERRKRVDFIKEYLLIDPTEKYKETTDVNINKLNVDINALNVDIGTQSKVKGKRKEKEKEKENISDSDIYNIRKDYPGDKVLANAKKKLPNLIKEHSSDELIKAIENYKRSVEAKRKSFPELKYMNESTFWNGRYIDYLDENYVEVKPTPKIQQSQPTVNIGILPADPIKMKRVEGWD